MKRTLSLRKESLAELVTDELALVAAASGPSCNNNLCLTACTTCASDFQQCWTGGCVTTLIGCPPQTEPPNC